MMGYAGIARQRLNDIAQSYDTDKGPSCHNYMMAYEMHFAPLRDQARTVIEIGVLRGGSLKMWREYFSSAVIYGIDRNPACLSHEGDRIRVFIGDQGDRAFLSSMVSSISNDIDIIIDDACHIASVYRTSFEFLFPFVRSGGWYVIEDVNYDLSEDASAFQSYVMDGAQLGRRMCCGDRGKTLQIHPGLSDDLTMVQRSIESVHIHNNIIFIRKL